MASRTSAPRQNAEPVRDRAAARERRRRYARRAPAAALDVLLTDASASARERFLPVGPTLRFAGALARRPGRIARRAAELGGSLAGIVAGSAEGEPPRGDRRFGDAAWRESWLFRRLMQSYLAVGQALDGVIADAELDLQDERRVRFAVENVVNALAPTNYPWSNPEALKRAIDTGGTSFTRGARNVVRDLATPPRLPASVDMSKFRVGKDLAVTPGAVVLRTEVFELIQYEPQTDEVRSVPLLVVPPMINKYYITDLAPGRSMLEYYVRQGQQVLAISWRNPDERHRNWDLGTYCESILEALAAAHSIAGVERAHVLGLCSGGIAAAAVAGHLAAKGELDRLAGLTLGVCVIDNERAGTVSALVSRESAAMAVADSARRGYLDGRALEGVFAWLRPNDMIWSYVANNYLLGKDPPAFDILYWNADVTRMAAGLHRDFIQLALENSLAKPGGLTVLGTPVDLGKVTVDAYVVAAIADHIVPWENAYLTTQLLGGNTRFVLSTSGHVAAMVNPPGNERASYHTRDADNPPLPEVWLEGAPKRRGTWWTDWDAWLAERSGRMRPAPPSLGNSHYKVAGRAPGTYVLAK
ncbi:MAG: poly(3-hydroxyalkanoate) polymerase [Thermoleophilaceae bacterium]|nr:poly(3-hydroxyalkanoate) polymerase [Thermoleophilaceae bacterium]